MSCITARRDVYIQSIDVNYVVCGSCHKSANNTFYNRDTCPTKNFRMKKGECITLATYTDVSHRNEIEYDYDAIDYMIETDYYLPSFKVGHSCGLDSDYSLWRHTHKKSWGRTYMRYNCYSDTHINIYYFDDAEIYKSWK